ncbi:MAG: ORF6N domain-containing protein [Proteobacteria bacterium]|nr:ORF6N domain-containing protein [Pseudomonadota bacterium]NOG59420.1 ORF6N domain-containing protein [Pseudomonadota bacterium]
MAKKKKITSTTKLIPLQSIANSILFIRGQKVLLDADLASLYEVETRILTRAVKRNIERFPEDFMFQLSEEEHESLRSHFGISSQRGGRRYPPYAFTEQSMGSLWGQVLNLELNY